MHLHRCVAAAPSANPDFLPFDRAESHGPCVWGIGRHRGKGAFVRYVGLLSFGITLPPNVPGLTDNFSANFHPLITACNPFTGHQCAVAITIPRFPISRGNVSRLRRIAAVRNIALTFNAGSQGRREVSEQGKILCAGTRNRRKHESTICTGACCHRQLSSPRELTEILPGKRAIAVAVAIAR